MKTKHTLVWLIPLTMMLAFLGFAATIQSAAHTMNKDMDMAVPAGTAPGGPFTLTDQDGKTVTDKDFTGKYRLVYFGFTSCPDVCPLDMRKMTDALNMIGPRAAKVAPIFITVDPERDTPKVLKSYVGLYKPSPVGLTGSPKAIEAVENGYKVYAAKAKDSKTTDYTMNHSAYIYLMGPDGQFIDIFGPDDKAPAIAARLTKLIPAS